MTTLSLALPFGHIGGGFWHFAAGLAARWRQAQRLRETRRYVAQMDDRMLSDIGVSRAQAAFELDHPRRRGALD